MTEQTQPNHFERLFIVVVMGVWFTLNSTKYAMAGANKYSASYRIVHPGSRGVLGVFAFLLSVLFVIFSAMFFAPSSAGFLHPSTLLFNVIRNVFLVSFVDFLGVVLAVLAVTLFVFLKVFKSVLSIVFLPCFGVFEWHRCIIPQNVTCSGGSLG